MCFSESNRGRGNAVVVGLPQNGNTPVRNAYTAPGGHVTLITLNNECKFNSPQLDGAGVIDLYKHWLLVYTVVYLYYNIDTLCSVV